MKIKKPKLFNRTKNYLDLTNNNWKNNSKWNYLGYVITKRPYRKKILALSLVLMACSAIFPDLGIGLIGGVKILNKWG